MLFTAIVEDSLSPCRGVLTLEAIYEIQAMFSIYERSFAAVGKDMYELRLQFNAPSPVYVASQERPSFVIRIFHVPPMAFRFSLKSNCPISSPRVHLYTTFLSCDELKHLTIEMEKTICQGKPSAA